MKTRDQIGQLILDAASGADVETSLLAQADAMATSIGGIHYLAGYSQSDAEKVAEELHRSVLDHIRRNWGRIEVAPERRQ